MVGRREELARAVVVDLDGTLLRQNSFRLFVRSAMRTRHRFRIIWATILRKTGVLSHNEYRERCLRLTAISHPLISRMGDTARYSTAVVSFIEKKQAEGYRIIVATAALEGYIRAFWNGEYIASTHDCERITNDCRGVAKLRAVSAYLDGRIPEYMLSDSADDYPLMKQVADAGGHAILVNPDKRNRRFYSERIPGIRLMTD